MVDKVEKEFFARLEKLEIERNGLKQKLIEMTAECNRLEAEKNHIHSNLTQRIEMCDRYEKALLYVRKLIAELRLGK